MLYTYILQQSPLSLSPVSVVSYSFGWESRLYMEPCLLLETVGLPIVPGTPKTVILKFQ